MSNGERSILASVGVELFGSPFRDEQLLKSEAGVGTWRAVDRDGSEVVVKIVTGGTHTAHELGSELDVLDALALPGTAVPIRAVVTSSYSAVVRPFVPGPTLREQLAHGPASIDDVLALASALLDTLHALHARDVVHGDIKPSNIVLANGAWSTPVLVDFGLARHRLLGDTLEQIPLDALRYMAPEQAGLLERRIDSRADVYAVGLCMYEAVSHPPFSAETVSELLRHQLTTSPPPLPEVVPAAFERIVRRLLRKDPRDRYQTACGARADVCELVSSLARGDSGDELVVGARDLRGSLTEPAFTGRRDQLDVLMAAVSDASIGSGGIVLVEGESGCGKTWLLEELCRRAVHKEHWVCRGQGAADVAQHPYHVLSGIARNVVASASPGSPRAIRIVERAGQVGSSIVEALPMMGVLFDADTRGVALDPNAEQRSLAGLSVFLDALGSEQEAAIVLVDDAQWIDAPTLNVLERWGADDVTSRHVLVVLAFRSEDVADDHPLHRMNVRARIELARFSDHEVRQEIASMAGDLPAAVVELVAAQSAGNPFLASALLHALVESQVLSRDVAGWQFAEHALDKLRVTRRILDAVATRIATLAPPIRRVLAVGALLGKAFVPALAADLCQLALRDVMPSLRELRGRLVWLDGTTCVFLHDRIRESFLSELAEDERRRLHLEAAKRTPADRVFELAYHYDAAGAPEQAFDYALEAADRAKAQQDMALAERCYRICGRGITDTTDRMARFRVVRGLGEVLLIRSHYDECERCLDEAFQLAPDQARRADIEERRAQLALKRGDLPDSIRCGENALRLVNRYVPRSRIVCMLIVLWEVLVQVFHTRFPRWFVGRRSLDGAEEEMFAIRVLNGLNGPYFFARGAVWVLWAHLRALNLAERYPATRELGREYGVHGSACAGFPSLFERAIRYTRRGAEICAGFDDTWGEARALQFHALNLCTTGRYREAIAAGERGGQLFDRAGDIWNAQGALNWAALARYRMGDLAGCVESAKRLYERGKRLDSALGISFAIDAWVRAVEGRLPAKLLQEELARGDEHVQTSSIVAQAEALRLLADGHPAEAEQLLETWLRRMKQERAFFHESNVSMFVYLGTAQRRRAEALAHTDPKRSAVLLARALRTSRRAIGKTRRFRNCVPHALREAALTEAMAGDVARARVMIDASIAAAKRLDARFEIALSQEARGELGPAVTGTRTAAELAHARRELATMRSPLVEVPPRITVSLVDRFEAVLEVGRRIASSIVITDVHTALREGALALLRAQHASITAGHESVLYGDALPVSGALVDAATRGPLPAVWSAGVSTLDGDAVLERSTVRSALCAPIVVRGEVSAYLYVTHGAVAGAFGDEEQRIAAFLATLAGAALENAEGFAAIQALSRDLEQRVEARTAELATANRALAENLRRLQDTQEQLVHAGRMAAVGTLIAGLSHELNNPLSVILGNVEHLQPLTFPDPRVARMIDAIARNGKRAARLVDTLLRFSRNRAIASDHAEPEELIHVVVELVAAEARTRQIDLRVSVPDNLPELVVVRHEIESALVNLATNALQATPAGGRVELCAVSQARDSIEGVCFLVRDTGGGIAPDLLPQIFDPFFTTKPEGQGTGLGLSLARQAATAHRGWLDAESVVGRGTVMKLWLPA